MKLKFKDQQFQIDATASVCDVFEGQPYHDPTVYTVDPGRVKSKSEKGISAEALSLPGLESVSQGRLDLEDDPDIQIIVMNVQAFNARGADVRRIFMALDEFGSRKPIDLIAANRPILILDEPQKMEGTATQEMLPKFNPLFILRYSATHKTLRNLVYKLDAIDAFDQKLVKKIEPICIDVTNRAGNTPYVYLSEVRPAKDEPEAIIEIQRQKRDGSIDMETRVVRKGDDLYTMSGSWQRRGRSRGMSL